MGLSLGFGGSFHLAAVLLADAAAFTKSFRVCSTSVRHKQTSNELQRTQRNATQRNGRCTAPTEEGACVGDFPSESAGERGLHGRSALFVALIPRAEFGGGFSARRSAARFGAVFVFVHHFQRGTELHACGHERRVRCLQRNARLKALPPPPTHTHIHMDWKKTKPTISFALVCCCCALP